MSCLRCTCLQVGRHAERSSSRLTACFAEKSASERGGFSPLNTARLQNRRRRAACITAVSNSEGVAETQPPVSAGRHAFLHDFCMAIPYGAIIVLTGAVVAFFKGPPAVGVLLMLSGLGVLALAAASLRRWKVGAGNTVTTGVIAAISAYHTWIWGLRFKMLTVKGRLMDGMFSPYFALFALSAAMTLFAFYNIAAGGNPPKKVKPSTE